MELSNEEILVARAKCDKSLLFFTRLFHKYIKGEKFLVNDHHYELEEAWNSIDNYEYRACCINIPPRHSKTIFAIMKVARGLGMNPKSNWFYITASDDLRSESSTFIRDIVSSELFYRMYGVKLKKDQKARNLWRTDSGGGMKTASIFGQITGFGAGQIKELDPDEVRDFEGCIILDDIDKIDDTETDNAKSEKTKRVFFNTILSRRNSKDTPIINIQQRAGEDDSTSVILEFFGDDALHIVMPVIRGGKALWPQIMDLDDIDKIKESPRTAHIFATQYMQDPQSPNDKPFHKNKLKWFDYQEIEGIKQQSEGCLSYCDPKDDGTDYYAHPLGHLIGETLYITDAIHNQHNTEVTIPKSVNLIKEENCSYTSIETNSMGSMVWKRVRDESGLSVYAVRNQTNKMTRIATNEAFIIKNMAFCKDHPDPDYQSYIEKLTKFEYGKAGKPDDAPDATAGLATLTMARYRHLFQ